MQDLIWLTERQAAYLLVNRFIDDSLQHQYQCATSLARCSIAVLHYRGYDLLNLLRSHLQEKCHHQIVIYQLAILFYWCQRSANRFEMTLFTTLLASGFTWCTASVGGHEKEICNNNEYMSLWGLLFVS